MVSLRCPCEVTLCEHLSEEQVCKLRSYLMEFQDEFAKSDHDLGRTGLIKHTIDVYSGYWQVELDPSVKPKTAFIIRSVLYKFKIVPFGLCNAGATFELLVELVMLGLQWKICLIYLDDVIVYGESFDQELGRLCKVFLHLKNANLKPKAKKCSLIKRKVVFQGYMVSPEGISADPSNIESIKSWSVPKGSCHKFSAVCSGRQRPQKPRR